MTCPFMAIDEGHSDLSTDATNLKLSSVNSAIKVPVEYHHEKSFSKAYKPLQNITTDLPLHFFCIPFTKLCLISVNKKTTRIE